MRIKALAAQPDRAGRYTVRFENDTVMRLYRQTVEDFGLYPGCELSDAELKALRQAAGAMSAKMRAVRIIAATSVSKKDLEKRLIHKGEDPRQAKEAVQWMSDLHLVDDRATAEQIVGSCIRKGYGAARARQALYEKQIPRELWEEALTDYPDQMDVIVDYLNSHVPEDGDQKAVKKAIDALIRRGHSYSVIRRALEQISVETKDYPEG